MSATISQTPAENEPYLIDWTTRGLGTDTITASSFAASSPDITIGTFSFTGTTTTFWLTGGIPGKFYNITNTITTAGGLTMTSTVPFVCIPNRTI